WDPVERGGGARVLPGPAQLLEGSRHPVQRARQVRARAAQRHRVRSRLDHALRVRGVADAEPPEHAHEHEAVRPGRGLHPPDVSGPVIGAAVADASPDAPTFRALLIGCDLYLRNRLPSGASYQSLRGCVRDIDRIAGMLRARIAGPLAITRLAASWGAGQP